MRCDLRTRGVTSGEARKAHAGGEGGVTRRRWYAVGMVIFGGLLAKGLLTHAMPLRGRQVRLEADSTGFWLMAALYAACGISCLYRALQSP